MNNLNETQKKYLETLLQTSSIETLSTGICSVLLHSHGLGPDELLTVSLIYLGLCIDNEEAESKLSLLKKSDMQEAVDTYIALLNVLRGMCSLSDAGGQNPLVADGAVSEGLFPPEAPSPT